jgi:uncharacterized membrane-anchored protein YjiN (DUF445 family)
MGSLFLIVLVLATGAMAVGSVYAESNRAKYMTLGTACGAFMTFVFALALKPDAYGVYVLAALAASIPALGGMS